MDLLKTEVTFLEIEMSIVHGLRVEESQVTVAYPTFLRMLENRGDSSALADLDRGALDRRARDGSALLPHWLEEGWLVQLGDSEDGGGDGEVGRYRGGGNSFIDGRCTDRSKT